MRHRSAALAATAALALLATPALAIDAKYQCADGTHLMANFSPPGVSPGSVTLVIAGASGEIELPQALSADGGRYADDDTEFWIKGSNATFTRSGSATTCHSG